MRGLLLEERAAAPEVAPAKIAPAELAPAEVPPAELAPEGFALAAPTKKVVRRCRSARARAQRADPPLRYALLGGDLLLLLLLLLLPLLPHVSSPGELWA